MIETNDALRTPSGPRADPSGGAVCGNNSRTDKGDKKTVI